MEIQFSKKNLVWSTICKFYAIYLFINEEYDFPERP